MFDEMPNRDVVSWTAMISGYASSRHYDDAWAIFCCMVSRGVSPNEYTLSVVLTACRGLAWPSAGAAVHATAARRGVDGSAYVENALLDMYASCGDKGDAEALFEGMTIRTAVSWTTMIAWCTRRGDGHGGIMSFKRMIQETAELNAFACSIAIHACTSIGALVPGRQLHALVLKAGQDSNIPVANSLLDMYSRCMSLSGAKKLFYEMPHKDLITWNIMIANLERSNSHEALVLFLEMVSEDQQPNSFTFTSIAAACANLAVLSCGQQVHGAVFQRGFGDNLQTANALIDMYAKCGSMADSRKVFDEMTHKDLVSWTSLMTGYGMNGYGAEAIELFDEMVHTGIEPDHIVFMAVINACSHAGLLEEGLRCFDLMTTKYSTVSPSMEVYGCVVDLLGRAGRLIEAYEVIKSMPFEADESVWSALLGACKMHKSVHLGRLAAHKILDGNANGATSTYVSLANMYAAGKEWGEFAEARRLLRGMGSRKEAGVSWIEVRDKVCSFASGGGRSSSPHADDMVVYEVLQMLMVQHMGKVGADESDVDLICCHPA